MAPSNEVLSSGSVVFALPHIRETIFRYHAIELVKERKRQLDAIDRPVTEAFWSSFPTDSVTMVAEEWFAQKRMALSSGTNFMEVLAKLGLQLSDYITFLASRPKDCNFWVTACSLLGGSRKWQGRGTEMRLEAAPRECRGGANVHEEPHSNPMEMMWHSAGYSSRSKIFAYGTSKWEETDGLGHLLRDDDGRIFFMRLLNTNRQKFFFDTATNRPDVFFSEDSPFWPLYEVIRFNEAIELGAAIWQCPPTPLSSKLLAAGDRHGRDELRRQLERAHALFAHLATLEEWGLSFGAFGPFSEGGANWFSTRPRVSNCVVSAYLAKSNNVQIPGKLARTDYLEEQLPDAPETAWPLAPLTGSGGIAGLPWCHTTAYKDPRVPGPRYFFHGLIELVGSHAEYEQQLQPYQWLQDAASPPANHFHHTLLNLTKTLALNSLYMASNRTIAALECSLLSEAYEDCLQKNADAPARSCEAAHSGLFDVCLNCALNWWPKAISNATINDPRRCAACGHYSISSAIPNDYRLLLLRILKPETRADGSKIILTAKEVHQEMTLIMDRELPRLTRLYTLWAEKQQKVVRIDTAGPLPLDKIRQDVSHHRWLMLEMLRGNFLDARFRKKEYVDLRDAMVSFHAEKRRKDEEREAKREARKRGFAAPPAVGASNSGSTAPTPTSEAEVSAQLSTAPCERAKRSASAADEVTAVKKLKGA